MLTWLKSLLANLRRKRAAKIRNRLKYEVLMWDMRRHFDGVDADNLTSKDEMYAVIDQTTDENVLKGKWGNYETEK